MLKKKRRRRRRECNVSTSSFQIGDSRSRRAVNKEQKNHTKQKIVIGRSAEQGRDKTQMADVQGRKNTSSENPS